MQLPLHPQMTNEEISQVFKFVGQVLGMDEKDRFRAQAYEEAGVVIHQLSEPLKDRFAQLQQQDPVTAKAIFMKQLDELPSIGESIAAKLVELFTTSKIKAFAKYTADLPGGMYPLVQLYGIGPKKAFKLAQKFHLNNPDTAIEDLLKALKQGKLANVEGFGEKSIQALIEILEEQHQKARISHQEALKVAEQLKQALLKIPQVKKIIFLGSLRRETNTVGDLDLGAIISNFSAVKKAINQLKQVKRVLAAGENVIRLILTNSWQVDLKLSTPEEWGSFIQHFTGSKEHNIRLREFAMGKNLSLSEHGIKDKKTGETKKFSTEKDFYNFLGLSLIPPKERIGKTEIEQYKLKS